MLENDSFNILFLKEFFYSLETKANLTNIEYEKYNQFIIS